MRHQRFDCALGGGVCRKRADRGACGKRGDEHDAAALAHDGQQLLHQKIRGAHVDGEQLVEVFDRGVLDAGRLRDAGIGDQNVEAIADDRANLFGQCMRTAGCAQIGDHLFGTAARFPKSRDDGFGLFRAAAVVNQNLRAGLGQ